MSFEQVILSKKDRRAFIREIKKAETGVFSYGVGSAFFEKVKTRMGADNLAFIMDEILESDIKAVINQDSKVDLDSCQINLFEYAEKDIKLPNQRAVSVKKATREHMVIQRENVIENFEKIKKSFDIHLNHLIDPILATMDRCGFETAGQAIEFLANA